jgi:hypothetical protein
MVEELLFPGFGILFGHKGCYENDLLFVGSVKLFIDVKVQVA